MGAGRQATSTSVATPVVNSCGQSDGIRRTDPFTGTGTVGRTACGIKPSLAEMRVGAIADADHQPGARKVAFLQPVQPLTGSTHHSGVGGHIHTGNPCSSVQGTEVCNGSQILIAGPTDQLDPAPPGEALLWIQPARSAFIGCHLRLRAPPISTMMRSRGSRLQRSHRDNSSEVERT